MVERYIFHLAFPVLDLQTSKAFYMNILGAEVGRENEQWIDVLLWGHQITLHCRPDDVLSRENQGKRHFGVVLPWDEWLAAAQRVTENGGQFMQEPQTLLKGSEQEQGKFYLEDPSFNVLEIKTYRDFSTTLGQAENNFNYTNNSMD